MKKYIALFLAFILAVSFIIPATAEESGFSITADSVTAAPGDTIAVKFVIKNNPGISLFTLGISYDETALKLKEINGNALMGGSFINNIDDAIVLWMSSSGDSSFNGTVFTATFEVLQSAAGKTEVSVLLPDEDNNILNYNGDAIDALIYSGFVDIESTVIFGDADSNGAVEAADLVALRAILLGNKTADAELLNVCDVNADGDIGISDLIRLKRYLAGEDVLLGA